MQAGGVAYAVLALQHSLAARPNLASERLRRDVRRLLTRYRDHGQVVRYSELLLRIQARFTFMHIERHELLVIIAKEAKRVGMVMEFDRAD
jgi:hypothetical protein